MAEKKIIRFLSDNVAKTINAVQATESVKLPDEKAFEYMLIHLLFHYNYSEIAPYIVDGANDGGIDFLIYDDEHQILNVCQSKYTARLDSRTVANEIGEAFGTVQAFINKRGLSKYRNALINRFTVMLDELKGDLDIEKNDMSPEAVTLLMSHIHYSLFTSAHCNTEQILGDLRHDHPELDLTNVSLYNDEAIMLAMMTSASAENDIVDISFGINISQENSMAVYQNTDAHFPYKVALCYVSMQDLRENTMRYGDSLFDRNVRKAFKKDSVDNAIADTLTKHPELMPILSNGITLSCSECMRSHGKINLKNASIINGCQSANILAKVNVDAGKMQQSYIPATIIAVPMDVEDRDRKIREIAIARNVQKTIRPQDLRSTSPELRMRKSNLIDYDICLLIKHGEKKIRFSPQTVTLKSDQLAGALLAFRFHSPRTARENKTTAFINDEMFHRVFPHYALNSNAISYEAMVSRIYCIEASVLKEISNEVTDDAIKQLAKAALLDMMGILGVICDLYKQHSVTISDYLNLQTGPLVRNVMDRCAEYTYIDSAKKMSDESIYNLLKPFTKMALSKMEEYREEHNHNCVPSDKWPVGGKQIFRTDDTLIYLVQSLQNELERDAATINDLPIVHIFD